MAIQFSFSPGPATSEAIRAAEKTLGVTIPTDYRTFLRKFNGGVPTPNHFRLPDGRPSWIEHLFSVYSTGQRRTQYDLIQFVENHREAYAIPESILPIGRFEHCTILCIRLSGKRKGQVVSDFAEDGFNFRKLRKVSGSMSDLVAELDSDDAHQEEQNSANRKKLIRALHKRDLSAIRRIAAKFDMSDRSWKYVHPVYFAIRDRDLELVQTLCSAGVSFETVFDDETPLQHARRKLRDGRRYVNDLEESKKRVPAAHMEEAEANVAHLTEITKLIRTRKVS